MNKVVLMGRLTRDPEVRYTEGDNPTTIARYTLADFIRCIVFGKAAEFTEKYLQRGIKVVISGRIQTGSYTNKEGVKVYTTDIVVEEQDFAESKAVSEQNRENYNHEGQAGESAGSDGFINVPEGLEEELPFS